MEVAGQPPSYIQELISELNINPFLKIKDYDLMKRGIEPNKIRRWFKTHYNMTFHAYQRMLRLNSAFTNISNGNSITHTAFESGFESLSGFNSSFHGVFGDSVSQSKDKNVVHVKRFTTPLGPMFACATQKGICLLEFTNRRMLETEFNDLKKRLNAIILPGDNAHIDLLQQELREYFEGSRRSFSVQLDPQGSEFQKSVWNKMLEIPYGDTWSYQEEATKLNKAKAVRAVASANGMNKISILIPCHRVIGKDGALKGYGGGLARKKWLLDHEKKHV
jgi:AraC family transcriptional regulator of adaptative response/methylated-DNA-[protein]-cysteine methyltransferase